MSLEFVYLSYVLWVVLGAFMVQKETTATPASYLETNNVLVALVVIGGVYLNFVELYLAFRDGYFYELLAFQQRAMGSWLDYGWYLLKHGFLPFLVQLFWLKQVRRHLPFTCLVALSIAYQYGPPFWHWDDVAVGPWSLTYTYSPPPTPANGSTDFLPSSWSYYPTTIYWYWLVVLFLGYAMVLVLLRKGLTYIYSRQE